LCKSVRDEVVVFDDEYFQPIVGLSRRHESHLVLR
jgi:hypothetical protein